MINARLVEPRRTPADNRRQMELSLRDAATCRTAAVSDSTPLDEAPLWVELAEVYERMAAFYKSRI